ncbi:IclR family transcriptional regulator [Micromonospora sp. NBC_00898]|uniref:IclR family transcriptional regulator n=1 Tax=Micromonospora sp. NBC_00898 TaxID=2975981 RepID=UPI00386DF3BB|nr:IclR family transcriptional regulator [Micromonospora sp. NBC_00898]
MSPVHRNEGEISAVGRVAALLNAFGSGEGTVRVAELTAATGLPKTTVHRLVREMIRCGLLEQDGARVRLGLRLFELGQLVPRPRSLRDAARPYMSDLHEATRHTVNLAVMRDDHVVYVEIVYGRDGLRLPIRPGGSRPAHATGVGKAIMAFSPPATIDALLTAGLPRVSARTITAPGLMRKELERIRAAGVSYDREESAPGVVCAASPVFGPDGEVLAALSVAGRTGRINLTRVDQAIRTAALAISRSLGATPRRTQVSPGPRTASPSP